MNRESLEAGVLFAVGVSKGLCHELTHPRDKKELIENLAFVACLGTIAVAGYAAYRSVLTPVQSD
jgi:hypothetical protein